MNHDEAPGAAPETQDEPVMDQNDATTAQKLQGIIEQTIADAEFQPKERLEQHPRERISDAGVEDTEEGFQTALAAVRAATNVSGV